MKKKYWLLLLFPLIFMIVFQYNHVNNKFKDFEVVVEKIHFNQEVKTDKFKFTVKSFVKREKSEEYAYDVKMKIEKLTRGDDDFFYYLYINPHLQGANQTDGIKTTEFQKPVSNLIPLKVYDGVVEMTLPKERVSNNNGEVELVWIEKKGNKVKKYILPLK
ncbi:hypothetical protein [Bacillus sp. RC51]|uniref:hypothetical protein n=1 Tax=Bacillus TaxID=1386 RepID=UPI0038375BF3